MWWDLFAVAWAGPLSEALEAAEKAHQAAITKVVGGTAPPSAQSWPLDEGGRADLTLRWWAMEQLADCARFAEMREALRRSAFLVAAEPLQDERLTPRFVELAGVEPWTDLTGEAWGSLDSFLFEPFHLPPTCPGQVLLDLREDLVRAGLGARETALAGLPLADALEVQWCFHQAGRGERLGDAETRLVAVWKRNPDSWWAFEAAKELQRGLAYGRGMWDACSGRWCATLDRQVAAALRDGMERPGCAGLVQASDRVLLRSRVGTEIRPDDHLGWYGELGYALSAMGCLEGSPRFADEAAVSAAVAALPARCAEGPTSTDLRTQLAKTRRAILSGCVSPPWGAPP